MEQVYIDWVVVILAAIVNMAIGFVWYSKWLFGPLWTKFSRHAMKKPHPATYFISALSSFLIAFFLGFFETYLGVTTVTDGMFVGFLCWLGFVATTQIGSVLWCEKPWSLFLINTGFKLFSFIVMGGLLGA
jgi:hypothetical protein